MDRILVQTVAIITAVQSLTKTARSYKMIAEEAKNISEFKFVWITDGGGWIYARRNLEETFNILDDLYNITDMENNIFGVLFK